MKLEGIFWDFKTNLSQSSSYYLDGIKNNDSYVVDLIYQELSQRVIQLVVENHGSVDQAKDVFQDVMVSLFTQSHAGLKIDCSFHHFFLMACRRRWLNVINSKYYERTESLDTQSETIKSINDQVNLFFEEEEKLKFVKDKLSILDNVCRDLIKESWELDAKGKYRSWMDIADQMNMSYGYVRKKASECKARLIELCRKDSKFYLFNN